MKFTHLLGATGALSLAAAAHAQNVVVVTSDIAANTTWSAANQYVLQGSVANGGAIRVLPGATLTIPAGTIVRGQPRTDAATYDAGSLVVMRGARLVASGTNTNPVVFTTAAIDADANDQPDGFVRSGAAPGVAGANVVATRYNPAVHGTTIAGVAFWDRANQDYPAGGNAATAVRTPTATGLWGGVLVLGRAPVNVTGGNSENAAVTTAQATVDAYAHTKPVLEGFVTPDYAYGSDWAPAVDRNGDGDFLDPFEAAEVLPPGTGAYTPRNFVDPHDDSGSITYISIRHGGTQLGVDNEINGLTLAGIGDGTKVEGVEIWGNEDDGVEIFGGTVNLRKIAIIATKDDGLDLDQGYAGKVQEVLVVGGSYADKALEWDGDDGLRTKGNYEPRAAWEVRNGTFIGGPTTNPGNSTTGGRGAIFRNNAQCRLYNSIFQNTTADLSIITTSTLHHVIRSVAHDKPNTISAQGVTSALTSVANVFVAPIFALDNLAGDVPATMQKPTSVTVRPGSGGGSAGISVFGITPGESFFSALSYRGAFPTVAGQQAWTTGWTAANRAGVIANNL